MAERSRRGFPEAALAVALLFLSTGCTPMDDLLAGIFGRSMRDQPSIGAYQNPQLPPEGSVPFAAGNFPARVGEVGLGQPEGTPIPAPVTAIEVLQATGNPEAFPRVTALPNPVPASSTSLARGEVVFNRSCAPCHGATGIGDGPVTQAGVPPISIVMPAARDRTDGYLYSIIRIGRGAMPPYGHQISHFDRWHVVNYLRQLQQQAASTGQDD